MNSSRCAECGAIHTGELDCQTIFDSFLALEFSDPGYGEVHFLTVACFMIQHGRYSDQALIWIERSLRAHLEDGTPVENIRRQAALEADQSGRTWKMTRTPGDPPPPAVQWSMTIADVAAGYQDAESYRALVRQWAQVTLKEMRNDSGRV